MFNKFVILLILPLMLLIGGCATGNLHIERDGIVVNIDAGYLMQDKRFKSLEYDSKTGIIKIERFASETSEVVSDIVNLVTTLKP